MIEIRYYPSGGQSWLGMRSVSTGETITPVAGPLADSTTSVRGLTLRYRDGANLSTTDPAAVRTVEIAMLGVTDQPIHWRGSRLLVDTMALTSSVTLRNASRP